MSATSKTVWSMIVILYRSLGSFCGSFFSVLEARRNSALPRLMERKIRQEAMRQRQSTRSFLARGVNRRGLQIRHWCWRWFSYSGRRAACLRSHMPIATLSAPRSKTSTSPKRTSSRVHLLGAPSRITGSRPSLLYARPTWEIRDRNRCPPEAR